MSIHIPTDEQLPAMGQLAEMFAAALNEKLRGTGIDGEIRRSDQGYELRLAVQLHAAMTISDAEVLQAATSDIFVNQAEHMIDDMKKCLRDASEGSLKLG